MKGGPSRRTSPPESAEPGCEFHLADLLEGVGVELLDKKGSARCRSCGETWTVFNENGEFFFSWWCCPSRCNV
jgi:hypothetical protein